MTERLIVEPSDWIAAVEARIAERGETYAEVEQRAGLGEGYLGKLMSERKRPTLRTVGKVNRAIGLALSAVSVL
jgi:DNA-binding phage protein